MKKKIMTMLMVLAVSCMIMPTNAKATKKAYIKTATGSKATVFVGKTLKLNAKTVGKKKKITYKTSKKSVATVNSKGVIKGKKYGTAKITMKASGVKTKKITVYVRKAATGIKLSSAQTINFYKTGNTAQIKAAALPGGKQMASKTLTYKSSNPQVAVVDSKGKVTAKKGGYSRIQISTSAGSGKICTKDVDVFVYDGFDDVCSETSGSKTTFTFNPNWKSVTIYFTSQTGKQYSYKVDSIKTEFNMLANVKGFADERNGVAVSKDSAKKANIINFKIMETGEDYDVLADAQRYQLTFYKALNNKVTFNVEK